MSIISLHALNGLLREYGYLTVFLGIMLESIGVPLPGESLMIAAAIYAATTHSLSIYLLVPAAAAGAILGDQIGYGIGRSIGFAALKYWGCRLASSWGVTEQRVDLGRYLFHRYGGRVVFLGRFVAFLRTFCALLAGANYMPWHRFLLWNAAGGIAWTCLYGFGAYVLGKGAERINGPMGIVLGVIGVAAAIAALIFVKRNEQRLIEEAEADMKQTNRSHARAAQPV